jgi:hypothetical protein
LNESFSESTRYLHELFQVMNLSGVTNSENNILLGNNSDTPVEEPPRDPNAPTRDNTNGGDQSPKPDRSNPNNSQDPNQVPRSPKKDR